MSGMGDGYVGTAQDAVRIRRLEKQREAERKKIQDLKNKSASTKGQSGLLQFGSGTSEILETAFKKETVGLVTREQYVEKRVNIRTKIEEEEKEKLQKIQQEEEELQMQKLKKRKIRANPRLSFSDDLENGCEEEDGDNIPAENKELNNFGHRGFGKDPTVETSFLPDSEREAEEQAERERLRKQWLREQEHIKNEPLQITYSYYDGAGDSIGEFLRAVQQQLAPEFREIRTTSVENLLYVKEDLIIPHQHSFYELIVNKARGKSGPLFHFDVHEDVRTIADATIEKDEIYDPTKKWERYTIHVARCQSESEAEVETTEDGELGIVGDDVQDFSDGSFSPAPGVETVCVFPKNPSKSVVAGEAADLLIGLQYEGESNLKVIAVHASVHLPYDHNLLVQNLTTQAGTFDLVGIIVYEIDQTAYQSTFYNGTIEVAEAGGPLSVESVFLFSLAVALLVLFGLWVRTQISQFSKKTKRTQKVEVGTATTDASMDEWLEGTAYTQSSKLKKKK
ncbi:hypothetical protein AG4045_016361 [Apium graveolens]|uniref:FAM50A/XAP5 C-terminal domain-containing protein n=1 Tax=Apium graveolens TaxID=4045 RepID=A0A6L5B8X5_APIGR|nr:hypothetical protein AG4045_016361 [Apium graveolens]